MTYRVTASTMGSVTPGPAVLSGGYRWRGIPDWKPGDTRYRDRITDAEAAAIHRGRENAAKGHEQRLAEYAAARRAGRVPAQAAEAVRIAPRTARSYEADYLASQNGDAS